MADAFAALESRSTETEAEQPTPAQIKAGRAPQRKPAAPPAEKPATAPEETATEDDTAPADTKPVEAKAETAPAKAKRPSDYMREEIARLKTERDGYKSEIEKVKAQPAAQNPEFKTLSEKLTATEKRAKEYEDVIRTTAYERSAEFKERFDQPFLDSYAAGVSKVKALKVVNEDGTERAGTIQDWESIANAPNEDTAAERIEALFGTGVRAQMVTKHYMEAVDKFKSKQQALVDSQKASADRQARFEELQTQLKGEVKSLWETQTKLEAVPDQWRPYVSPKGNDKDGKPIDADWDAALQKGFERYDRAMSEDARNPNLSTEQRKEIVSRAAAVRNQAAAFRPLVAQTRKLTTRVAELEAELEAYRNSEPGAGNGEPTEAEQQISAGSMSSALSNLEKLGKAGTPAYF